MCPQVAWVPGSFELPLVAKAMAKSGKYDAVITVGAVVCASIVKGLGVFHGCITAAGMPLTCGLSLSSSEKWCNQAMQCVKG